MSIPAEVDYSLTEVKGVQQKSYVSRATNGSVFGDNQQIQFNLINNKATYIVPESLYLSAKIKISSATSALNTIMGLPGVSVVQRSDLFCNSTNIETINNYNAVVNALIASKTDIAQRNGMSKCFGNDPDDQVYYDVDGSAPNDEGAGNDTLELNVSVPLCNALANSAKYIPLDSGMFILYLTLSSAGEFCIQTDGTAPDADVVFQLSEAELHYKCLTFGMGMDQLIKSAVNPDGNILFKSESYASSVANLPAGSSGAQAFSYASSYSSIKSLFTLFTSGLTKNMASYNPNFQNIYWQIASENFPQTAITKDSDAVIEYLEAVHGINSNPTAFSTCISKRNWRAINTPELSDNKNLSKAFFGVNVEAMSAKDRYMAGVSSQNSNVVLRLDISAPVTASSTIIQVFHYDLVMVYNPALGQMTVMK